MLQERLPNASRRSEVELERLLEAIATGTIADLDDLDEGQEALLRAAYPSIEDLDEVLFLIRNQVRDER
jgi:hypothetical protein